MTKQEKLLAILKTLEDTVDKTAFENLTKLLLKLLADLGKKQDDRFFQTLKDLQQKIENSVGSSEENFSSLKQEILDILGRLQKESSENLNFIRDKVRKIKEGKDGQPGLPGKDADEIKVALEASKQAQEAIKPLIPTIPQIRDGLENLEGSERLKIEAIDKLREELDELKKRPQRIGGGGFNLGALNIHLTDWTVIGTGDDVTTEFTLSVAPNPIESLEIKVGNADMFADDDFTYSSSTKKITFLAASIPASGAKIRQKCRT